MIGTTKIETQQGRMEISKLAQMQPQILKKYKAISYNKETNLFFENQIKSVYEVSTKRPTCKFYLENGASITCDIDTPLFCSSGLVKASQGVGEQILYHTKKLSYLSILFVEILQEEDVFLIELEDNRNFVANNVVMTNSWFLEKGSVCA